MYGLKTRKSRFNRGLAKRLAAASLAVFLLTGAAYLIPAGSGMRAYAEDVVHSADNSIVGTDADYTLLCDDGVAASYDSATHALNITGTGAVYSGEINAVDSTGSKIIENVTVDEGITMFGYSRDQYIVIPNDEDHPNNNIALYLPSTVERVYVDDYNLTAYSVPAANPVFKTIDGVLYIKEEDNKSYLYDYPVKKSDTTFSVPTGQNICGINRNALKGNDYLQTVTVPDSVDGYCYFNGMKNLKTVNLGKNTCLDLIDQYSLLYSNEEPAIDAFEGDFSLEAINVAEGNYFYESKDGVLYGKNSRAGLGISLLRYPVMKAGSSFEVPKDVTEIADFAFGMYACSSGEKTKLITSEGGTPYTFPENSVFNSLETVTFETDSLIKIIGVSAFENCRGLSTISLPETVEYVQACAFDNTGLPKEANKCVYDTSGDWLLACYATTADDITLKEGSKRLADYAFHNAAVQINKVTLPVSTYTIGLNPFVEIYDNGSSDNNISFFKEGGTSKVKSVEVAEGCALYKSEDGIFYGKLGDELYAIYFSDGSHEGTFTVPSPVQYIADFAFINDDGSKLEEIVIPDSLLVLGYHPTPKYCTGYKTKLTYTGTQDGWDEVMTRCIVPYKYAQESPSAGSYNKFFIFGDTPAGHYVPLTMSDLDFEYCANEPDIGVAGMEADPDEDSTPCLGYNYLPGVNIKTVDPNKVSATVKFAGKEGKSSATCTLTDNDGNVTTVDLPYKTADEGAKLSADVDPDKTYEIKITSPGHLPYKVTGYKPGTSSFPSSVKLLAGDININSDKTVGDGFINVHDHAALTAASNKKANETGYYPEADFNKDDVINTLDRSEIVKNYLEPKTAS